MLTEENNERSKQKQGDFKEHIKDLRYGLIKHEADYITEKMIKCSDPKQDRIPLSPEFVRLTSTADWDTLVSLLPCKKLSFKKAEVVGNEVLIKRKAEK